MEDLNDDLMMEILIRLPVRAAHQCKAVSKHWHSLICNADFKDRYCRHRGDSINNYILIVGAITYEQDPDPVFYPKFSPTLGSYEERYITNLSLDNEYINKKLLRISLGLENLPYSLHGLLFVSKDLMLLNVDESGAPKLMMYNALTREEFMLPPGYNEHDPKQSINLFSGCLCSQDKDEYKVVVVATDDPSALLHTSVFSSSTGKWRHYQVNKPLTHVGKRPGWGARSQYAIDCNGRLYWVMKKIIIVYDPFKSPGRVDSIDFPDELYKAPKLRKPYFISNVRGCIRLYDFLPTSSNSALLSYWDLNDYNRNGIWSWTWTVRQHIDLSAVNWPVATTATGTGTTQDQHRRLMICVVGFNHFGDVVYLYFHNTHSLLAFNLTTKSLDVLTQIKDPGCLQSFRVFTLTPPSWPTTTRNLARPTS